jgi:heterodisulfide reductase subunit A
VSSVLTSKEEKRIGLYICTCFDNLTDRLDYNELIKFAENLPGIVVVSQNDSLCSTQGQKFLAEECRKGSFDTVVVAACTPKIYESTIGRGVVEGGLSKYQYDLANIREQCAWIHDDKDKATQKAKRIIAGAVARARFLEALEDTEFPTHNCGICCIQSCKNCVLTPKIEDLNQHEKIEILFTSEVTEISGGLGGRHVKIKTPKGIKEIDVGTVIIATGSKIFDSSKLSEYGSEYEDVITTIELEKLIMEERKSGSGLKRTSDGKVPKTINFIQCVGSRDANRGNPHCSLVCCTYAIGQAMEIKKRYPDTQVYIHYMDLRGPYRGFEEFYEEAKAAGVNFVRGRVSEVFRSLKEMAPLFSGARMLMPEHPWK